MCYCFETCVGFLVLMISLMNKSRWLICWFKESTITVWRKHGNNFKQTKMHHLLIWFLFTGWFNRMTNTSTIRIRCMLGPTVLYTCVYTWIPNFFVFLYFIKESKDVTIFTSKYIDISYQTYSLDTSIQLKIKSSLHWKTRFVYIMYTLYMLDLDNLLSVLIWVNKKTSALIIIHAIWNWNELFTGDFYVNRQ